MGAFGNDVLVGGSGNDNLDGAGGDLFGGSRGFREIDVLIGGEGADTFTLFGDAPHIGEGPNYSFSGEEGYAVIADFNRDEDIIALADEQGLDKTIEYSLGASPSGLPTGTGLFVEYGNNPTAPPDLIAIVQGVSPDSLNLASSYFKMF